MSNNLGNRTSPRDPTAADQRPLVTCNACGATWRNNTGVCESCGSIDWSAPSAADLAATVRDRVVQNGTPHGPGSFDAYMAWRAEGIAALAALVARCEQAEREAARAWCFEHKMMQRAVEAEERLEAAERRVAELEAALSDAASWIENYPLSDREDTKDDWRALLVDARAALEGGNQ